MIGAGAIGQVALGQGIASYSLTANAGAFVLTGQAVGLRADRRIVVGAGTFSLSGQPVSLEAGYEVAAGTGSFVFTGQTVRLLKHSRLVASPLYEEAPAHILFSTLGGLAIGGGTRLHLDNTTTFAFIGNPVGIRATRHITVGLGVFTLTGNDVSFNQFKPRIKGFSRAATAIFGRSMAAVGIRGRSMASQSIRGRSTGGME